MKAVLQRVSNASVTVDGQVVGKIGRGWLIFLGVAKDDSDADVDKLVDKVVGLRAFEDSQGKMNLGLNDILGGLLVVSQFTLLADCSGGRRPSFTEAAPLGEAERLYLRFVAKGRERVAEVATGIFRADMKVELINDGPVTFLLDTRSPV